jgi:hypothetical protein
LIVGQPDPHFCAGSTSVRRMVLDRPEGGVEGAAASRDRRLIMAMQGGFKVACGDMFPFGVGVVGAVTPVDDFDASTKDRRVQARDRDSGMPLWQVDVMDFDPDARERTFRVKLAAAVQPVPPAALDGLPVRPVWLEGLTVTPWIKDGGAGMRPKIAYSLRASGLVTPKRNTDTAKAA